MLYITVHGHERVYNDLKTTSNKASRVEPLLQFAYTDEVDGKDYGEAVRNLAHRFLQFIHNEDMVKDCRVQAAKGEFPGFASDGTIKTGMTPRKRPPNTPSSRDNTPSKRVDAALDRSFDSVSSVSEYNNGSDVFATPPRRTLPPVFASPIQRQLLTPNLYDSPQVPQSTEKVQESRTPKMPPLKFDSPPTTPQRVVDTSQVISTPQQTPQRVLESPQGTPQVFTPQESEQGTPQMFTPQDPPNVVSPQAFEEEVTPIKPTDDSRRRFDLPLEFEETYTQPEAPQEKLFTPTSSYSLSEIEQLRAELRQAKEQIMQLQLKNVDLERDLLLAANQTSNQLFEENEMLRKSLGTSINEVEDVKQQARAIIAKNEEHYLAEIAKHQEEITTLKEQMNANESDNNSRISQKNFETEQMRQQYQTTLDELQQTTRTRDEFSDTIRQLNRTIDQLKESLTLKEEETAQAQRIAGTESETLSKERDAAKEELNKVNQELREAIQNYEAQTRLTAKQTTEIEELKQQNAEMSIQMNNSADDGNEALEIKDKEIERLKRRLTDVEQELETTITSKSESVEQARVVGTQLAEAEEAKQKLQEQLDIEREESKQVTTRLSELKTLYDKVNGDFEDLTAVSQREKERLEGELQTALQQKQDRENQLAESEHKLLTVVGERDQLQSLLEQLRSQVHGYEEEIKQHESRIAELQEERDGFERALNELKHRFDNNINRLNSTFEQQIEAMKQLMTGVRQEIHDF
jgi:hypothetical protein